MGSIYKRERKASDGKPYKESFYTLSWFDHSTGRQRTRKGFKDKRASQELLRQLEERSERQAVGLPVAPDAQSMPPVEDAIARYANNLERLGRSESYRKATASHLRQMVELQKWGSLLAIKAESITAFLADMVEKEYSASTCNQYRGDLYSFCEWCIKQGWLEANPVARVEKASLSGAGDVSRRPMARRAFTVAEFQRLVNCEKVQAWRREVYLIAGLSGLRWREMKQLQPCDFTLGASPRWHPRAEITKGKRREVVPMLPECAAALGRLMLRTGHRELVFPRWPNTVTVQNDIVRAGIEPRDASKRVVNFHSLRYFFCTLVGKTLPIQLVRKLMRHKNIKTTFDIYFDLQIEDAAEQVATLPALFELAGQNQEARDSKEAGAAG